jgi:hypothetical protein
VKTIIAGTRTLSDALIVESAINLFYQSGLEITEVVSGGASGVDSLGEQWAERNGVRVRRFPADWNKHGRAAGPIRNKQMAEYAEALLLIWDGKSRGSASMKREAEAAGLAICEITVEPTPAQAERSDDE